MKIKILFIISILIFFPAFCSDYKEDAEKQIGSKDYLVELNNFGDLISLYNEMKEAIKIKNVGDLMEIGFEMKDNEKFFFYFHFAAKMLLKDVTKTLDSACKYLGIEYKSIKPNTKSLKIVSSEGNWLLKDIKFKPVVEE